MGLMCEIDEGKKLCATREHHNYLKHAMREFWSNSCERRDHNATPQMEPMVPLYSSKFVKTIYDQ